jgi:hypothetical protein
MKWYAMLVCAGALMAGGSPRLVLSKSFPGSVPPYSQVTVARTGEVEYREAPDEELPLKFKLRETEAAELFGLVEKLDYFRKPLESPTKVAFMGTKDFRYEDGERKSEAKFNYTEDVDARSLADWFERMSESAQRRIELDRAAKYDRLGVVKALTLLEFAMENKRIVGASQFLPTLDRIAKNEGYMHTARMRAAALAESIRKAAAE